MPRTIAILGGTGAEGSGLARRFARAGERVIVGSRDAPKARDTAAKIEHGAAGMLNAEAAAEADIAILTVPVQAQIATLKSVRQSLRPGAILVDATVPLEVAIGGKLSHPLTLWSGSAAEQAARNVPAGVAVVAAFHCLSADLLAEPDRPLDSDVFICGDDSAAKATIGELTRLIPGARPLDAGPLENARLVEYAAALVVSLNLRHKSKHGGIRITGLGPAN